MKQVTPFIAALFTASITIADEPVVAPATDTLRDIVAVAQENFENISTLTAIYEFYEIMPGRRPRRGDIHLAWDRLHNCFRSNFVSPDFQSDSVTTPTEFIRIHQSNVQRYPASESRQYWSADVLSPARLFGTQDRPLWQSLKNYITWPEANDRITITSHGADDDLVYTIRMAYTSNVSDKKVFVTRKLAKRNAFHPTLITKSIGIDADTADITEVVDWTYKTFNGLVIPRSVTTSGFDRHTGSPHIHRTLHLRYAKLNDELNDAVFDDEAAFTVMEPPRHDHSSVPSQRDSTESFFSRDASTE